MATLIQIWQRCHILHCQISLFYTFLPFRKKFYRFISLQLTNKVFVSSQSLYLRIVKVDRFQFRVTNQTMAWPSITMQGYMIYLKFNPPTLQWMLQHKCDPLSPNTLCLVCWTKLYHSWLSSTKVQEPKFIIHGYIPQKYIKPWSLWDSS